MLYLIRGIPGSGKSTYAKSLGCLVVEADMYSVRDGKYDYDHSRIGDAHDWCLNMAKMAIDNGFDVAVANTFAHYKFLDPYIQYANLNKVPFKIIKCIGNHKTIHPVPKKVIETMKETWENLPPFLTEEIADAKSQA